MRTALILVDMSVEQLAGIEYRKAEVVATINALLAACAPDASRPPPFDLVVDSRLWIAQPSQTTLSSVFPDVGHAGTRGAELLPELREAWDAIAPERKRFDAKLNYSSWYGTQLDELLRARRIERVCLAGVNTEFCIFAGALDSFYRGYTTRILSDAVTSMCGEQAHVDALSRASLHFGGGAVVRAGEVAADAAECAA